MATRIGPRKVDKPLVLYGTGQLGKLAVEMFRELRIPVAGIIDKASVAGYTQKNSLIAVCVATSPFTAIYNELTLLGFNDIVPVWDVIEAYPELNIRNGWFANSKMTRDEQTNILLVRTNFVTEESRIAYTQFVIWRLATARAAPEYILLDSKPKPRPLPSTLADIRKRQQHGLFGSTIAGIDFIYIHAEGSELTILEKTMSSFIEHRPIIKVACYHSPDGLWKIQKALIENLPDYIFNFKLTAYQGQAAYMYCFPML